MTKKKCPLGDACDLTTAWMAGAARARDNISAGHLHLQLKVNRVGGAYIEDDEGMELDCVTMDGAFNLRAVAEGLRQGPDRVAPLEAEVKAQAAEIEWYRDRVVWGFYEDETPKFYQGKEGEHEICEPVSAKEVSNYISEIERLQAKLAKAVEALRMIENIELTFLDECRDIARTTLAELTGGKDD